MRTEPVHTLILGAGPSGLAAGYTLAKAGLKPVVLERDKVSGGLMRSIQRGDFILDIGRKELYNRLAKVDELWSDILGEDYREYPHRGGILYDGQVIDMSPAYQGLRRGMSVATFAGCLVDFLWWRATRRGQPGNLEEYWHQQRGRMLTRVANQGFQEKLVGKKWVDVPMPAAGTNGHGESFAHTVKQALTRFVSPKEPNTYKGIWKHPAKGTGQICQSLERGILQGGGRVHHEAKVLEMNASNGRIQAVTAEVGGETIRYQPQFVVSSTPAEFLQQQLLKREGNGEGGRPSSARRRVVVLVYLFLNEPPRFPQFWLQVTCQKVRVGRIANYAALNSDMVPKGKTCLCLEYYCFGDDPLLKLSDEEMGALGLEECASSGLVDPSKCFDKLVLRFPGADASQNRHNWFSKERQQIFAALRQFENLFSVNRTDLDISTLAGIESAEAILSGDRTTFDRHFSPTELGIRSESKPFEFRNPPGVEI
jgi:protoporphyrinogen oxidase